MAGVYDRSGRPAGGLGEHGRQPDRQRSRARSRARVAAWPCVAQYVTPIDALTISRRFGDSPNHAPRFGTRTRRCAAGGPGSRAAAAGARRPWPRSAARRGCGPCSPPRTYASARRAAVERGDDPGGQVVDVDEPEPDAAERDERERAVVRLRELVADAASGRPARRPAPA